MIRQYQLVERVQRYNPEADEGLLNKAYVYAMKAHGSQKRASGDPFFSHPLEVAGILTELRLDDATIIAALLHDTVEDTDTSLEDIRQRFGEDVSKIVEGVTKIERLDLVSKRVEQAENLRRLIIAVSEDFRVLLVKLADRLHNMRTLEFMPEAKRARIAEETLDIYAPLAGRMGMHDMREELEDLSFRWLHPDAYRAVTERLEAQKNRLADLITQIEGELYGLLQEHGIKTEVSGRAKRAYSVWRKMERKSISFEQLSDILGFRIIVPDVAACYSALGLVHTRWRTVPGRFKDYISTPKQNDYQSLHTTVIGPGHQRVELQIRTPEMHEVAEFGVAAHVLYKDTSNGANGSCKGVRQSLKDSRAYQWLHQLVDLIETGESAEDFLEHTKLELFQDQVFCFTPKGRLIALPRGATPIDFAYAVHTDVGNSCVGCKINGKMAPLMTELSNGDEVEIIRSDAQIPPAAWESIVITGKARAAIRRASRTAIRAQYVDIGRQITKRTFERRGKTYSDQDVQASASRLGHTHLEDLLAAVGRGELSARLVADAVFPPDTGKEIQIPIGQTAGDDGWFGLRRAMGLKFRFPMTSGEKEPSDALPIRGVEPNMPVRFSPGSGAVPGDRIVGIMNGSGAITIYPIHSPELRAFEDKPELWLDVRWDTESERKNRFPAEIKVTAMNEPGTLAQIAQVIGENGANIDNVRMIARNTDFHEMLVDVEVWDLKHLNRIIRLLRERDVVSAASHVSN